MLPVLKDTKFIVAAPHSTILRHLAYNKRIADKQTNLRVTELHYPSTSLGTWDNNKRVTYLKFCDKEHVRPSCVGNRIRYWKSIIPISWTLEQNEPNQSDI